MTYDPRKAKAKMIHRKPESSWSQETGQPITIYDEREVRVMAIAEGYAMVRRKGAMPYVAPAKELRELSHD